MLLTKGSLIRFGETKHDCFYLNFFSRTCKNTDKKNFFVLCPTIFNKAYYYYRYLHTCENTQFTFVIDPLFLF